MDMCATFNRLSCYVYIHNGMAIDPMWYGDYFHNGVNITQSVKQMILLTVVAILFAVFVMA